MVTALRKNILATLAYYDVLEYPLTAFEVRKYLMNYHDQGQKERVPLSLVREKLGELKQEGRIGTHQGFYFLSGKEAYVPVRIAREKISILKLKRMRRLVASLRYLPIVRMVAATGSLSFRYGTRGSDWDMFIVLSERALFTGRMVVTLFLQLIGKRRHGRKIMDRACLNYYTGDKSLAVRLQGWYDAHEYQVMVPLFQTFARDTFYRANGWLLDFRSQAHLPVTEHRLTLTDTASAKKWRARLEKLFFSQWLESKLSDYQKERIAKNPKTKIEGACIIADEHSLIFFPHPRGPKIFSEFQKRLTFS